MESRNRGVERELSAEARTPGWELEEEEHAKRFKSFLQWQGFNNKGKRAG